MVMVTDDVVVVMKRFMIVNMDMVLKLKGNKDGDGHSGHAGVDGEVGDSNHGFCIVVVVVSVTEMVMVTVDMVVVIVRLAIVNMVLVLWW